MISATVTPDLDRLDAFPDQLRAVLQNQPGAAVQFRPREGAWSIAEILGHLIVFDARWGNRTRQMLAATIPHFIDVTPEEGIQFAGFREQAADKLLDGFAERRHERVAFLRTLGSGSLQRAGIHPRRGQMTIAEAIETIVTNDRERLKQIQENLAAYHVSKAAA